MSARADAGPPRLAVAASGGLDSTALLHCVHSQASRLGVVVHALHVHHGLHPDAARWQDQVERQCRRWSGGDGSLVFAAARLAGSPARGDSVEAWARAGRYAVLAALARESGCSIVLLAHHRRDQAETVLLQALRGGGAAGLAAMPRAAARDGVLWLRPWLDQPRDRIAAYARRWRLAHADDPSNADPRFARSRLRGLWPQLERAFGDIETAFAAVARRAQEAAAIVAEVAAADAAAAVDDAGALVMAGWRSLGDARRTNLLRHWLARAGAAGGVAETLVARLGGELEGRDVGRWPLDAGRELRLHRGRLVVAGVACAGHGANPPTVGPTFDLSRPGDYDAAPWRGRLQVERAGRGGVPAALLESVELRPRSGGERFQAAPSTPPRSLKKQFQSAGVDPWSRDGPLVYAGDRLLFVPGLGSDARAVALPGEDRRRLRWLPAGRAASLRCSSDPAAG